MREEYDFSQAKRGAILPSPQKTRITIMIDDDIFAYFQAKALMAGSAYQTMINRALRDALEKEEPLTTKQLRRVLREEPHTA
jgi:uncharacterized protein (DUF4415 family)